MENAILLEDHVAPRPLCSVLTEGMHLNMHCFRSYSHKARYNFPAQTNHLKSMFHLLEGVISHHRCLHLAIGFERCSLTILLCGFLKFRACLSLDISVSKAQWLASPNFTFFFCSILTTSSKIINQVKGEFISIGIHL